MSKKRKLNYPIVILIGTGGVILLLLLSLILSLILLPIHEDSYLHFSVDDSNSIFEDLTKNKDNYTSIFDNKTLRFVKTLHDKYGAVFSFYCFYGWDVADGNQFSLADATDAFRDEFSKESNWLRFGFHAKDALAYESIRDEDELTYYDATIKELIRITGSIECIDSFVRLDRYVASEKALRLMQATDNGIIGLLTADDPSRQSYDLSSEEQEQLYAQDWFEKHGLAYTPSDVVFEKIASPADAIISVFNVLPQKNIEVFTHEWILDSRRVKFYMTGMAYLASIKGIASRFTEDVIQ